MISSTLLKKKKLFEVPVVKWKFIHFTTCKELKKTIYQILGLYLCLAGNVVFRNDFVISTWVCIILTTVYLSHWQGRSMPAEGTTRKTVRFFTQSKGSWSRNVSLLFILYTKDWKLWKVCYKKLSFGFMYLGSYFPLGQQTKTSQRTRQRINIYCQDQGRNSKNVSARHIKTVQN